MVRPKRCHNRCECIIHEVKKLGLATRMNGRKVGCNERTGEQAELGLITNMIIKLPVSLYVSVWSDFVFS